MATHKWELRLRVEVDEGIDGRHMTEIVVSGDIGGDEKRPVNECIALDMGAAMQMLLSSGRIVCPSSYADTVEAFGSVDA